MIHLHTISISKGIETVSSTDLDHLVSIWRSANRSDAMGIVSIGSGQIVANASRITVGRLGRLYVTPRTLFVLPNFAEGLALSEPDDKNFVEMLDMRFDDVVPSGWIADIGLDHPDMQREMLAIGISNDAEYLEREHLLPPTVRSAAGLLRFYHRVDYDSTVSEIVRAAPPWLLDRSIDLFPLSVRLRNILVRENVERLQDIAGTTDKALLGIQNMGRKSYDEIGEIVLQAVRAGLLPEEASSSEDAESVELPKTTATMSTMPPVASSAAPDAPAPEPADEPPVHVGEMDFTTDDPVASAPSGLSPKMHARVLRIAEAALAGDVGRRWRSEELVRTVRMQLPVLDIDAHGLDDVLRSSKRATCIGPAVWQHDGALLDSAVLSAVSPRPASVLPSGSTTEPCSTVPC